MGGSSRSETVGAVEKLLFIDRLQPHRDRPFQHFVLHGGHPDGTRFRFVLRDVDSLHQRGAVRASLGAVEQTPQVRFQIFTLIGDRLVIHTRGAGPADFPLGFSQPQQVEVMTQRRQRAARVALRPLCDVLLAG